MAKASVPDLDVVRHEIELVFYSMEEKVSRQPQIAKEYRAAKYPLVVLADEVILTSAWSHAKQWETCLLEKKYYSTNIGFLNPCTSWCCRGGWSRLSHELL